MTDFIFEKYPALRDKNFVKFLASQLLSLSGGYIQNVAISAMIRSTQQNKTALGLFLFVSYLPVFLLSFPSSKLVGKVAVKPLLLITEGLLFGMSALLAAFADMPFYILLVFGGVWGCVRAFQTPAAASVPKLICEKEELSSAVGTVNLALALARAAGPIISGVIYIPLGFRTAFIVNAASYIPSFILLCKTKMPKKLKDMKKKSKPVLSVWLLVTVFAVSLCGTSYNIVFTGLSDKLSLSKIWFSVFMGCVGAGAVLGALFLSRKKQALFACVGMGALSAVMAVLKSGAVIAAAAVIYGLCDYLFFTSALRRINEQNNESSIGSAMGIYTAVTTGALPLGFLGMSYLSGTFGISPALFVSAAVICLVSVAFFGKMR